MPAPSSIHEAIVDEVWNIFQTDIVFAFGSAFDKDGVLFSLEPLFSNMVMGIPGAQGKRADFYFDPYDGYGPVVGEVGEMQNDKWANVNASDGAPIRILRIGFDMSIGMINPRFSKKEIAVLKVLQEKLNKRR